LIRDHAFIDRRSLALHRLAVDKIRKDPSLFAIVQANLTRWRTIIDPRSLSYLDRWQALVDEGMDRCLAVAIEDSEFGRNMRQSTPFAGILSNKERFEFFREYGRHEAN